MGCTGRLFALSILFAIVAIAWFGGPVIRDRLDPGPAPPQGSIASPALASSALARFEALVRRDAERAAFTAAEVESLLLYEGRSYLLEGVEILRVRFIEGEALIDVQVAFDLLPDLQELERVRQVLPEAVPLTLRGSLLTVGGDEAVFMVRRIDAVGVPLPRSLFSAALGSFAPVGRPELPSGALPLPLPAGVTSAYIDEDRLILAAF